MKTEGERAMGCSLKIKTPIREYTIYEGRPVIVLWRSRNKTRRGFSTAVGWIKRGEKPHTILLIHSCFQTWDKVEQEYPASWTIWESQIINIRLLSKTAE